MFDYSIWCVAIVLELMLLVRCIRGRYFRHYPIFYSYISFVLVQSLLRFTVYRLAPDWYRGIYWLTEFVGVIVGCSVVFEFYQLGLQAYAGVAKLARSGLLCAFLFTFSKVLFTAAAGKDSWAPTLIYLLERDLRFVQITGIAVLIGVALIYRIPMGRNLKGIIFGYATYLGLIVTNLTFLGVFGAPVQFVVARIQVLAYLVALLTWTAALWSYAPAGTRITTTPKPYSAILDETDEKLARSKNAVESILS